MMKYQETIRNLYKISNLRKVDIKALLIISTLFVLLTCFAYFVFPLRIHWRDIYRPATLRLIAGRSPYTIFGFLNPPWALIPLIPLAILPVKLGSALMSSITFLVYGFVAIKFGAKPLTLALFLFLPYTLYNLVQVNIDWLVMLGFLMPPQFGLFFVLLKPHIGGFVALFWLIESWRIGKIRKIVKVFSPVMIAFLLSFIVYGNYITQLERQFLQENKNFWPMSIPVGLALLVYSIRKHRMGPSITAGPLLSPYTQSYSWPIALLGILPYQWETAAAAVGLWIVWLFNPWINISTFSTP